MARGEDTSRDPRRQVSRLAHLMTTQATRYWNNMNLYADETPEETQVALDKHRNNRDTLGSDNPYVQGGTNLISSAFKNRHNDKYARPLMPIPGNTGPSRFQWTS